MDSLFIERMIESLSMCRATRGRISEIWMPGALVEMGLNPLLPLTSQVSRWLWPPKSQIMMQDWALAFWSVPAIRLDNWK